MDLVSFAEDLIMSDFLDEQLIGARILERFVAGDRSSAGDALRKVGTSHRTVERLVDMLGWKRPDEEEVRRCAAEVVCALASKSQNALRVSGIPGAIESVTSLLHNHNSNQQQHEYDHLPFNLLGLHILKRLARDHDNCGKIGTARGLLARIVDFTRASPALLQNPYASELQVRAVKRGLQVVKMLVYATGSTGVALRREVAENVFSVSNLCGILQHGAQHRDLQKLATDVLTGLAMEDRGTEAIVGTGGLVKLLLSMFFSSSEEETMKLGCEAGEALAMLALESAKGCAAILKQRPDVIDQIVAALPDGRCLYAARLLRNLCAYSGPEHRDRLRAGAIAKALPTVLRATMNEDDKVLEVSIGLTTEICKLIVDDGDRFAAELRAAGFDERTYVERLAGILRTYRSPEISVPRMRRFVVQQLIWLMTSGSSGGGYVELLRNVGMKPLLENVADTTSELECYHVFSGSVGIGKHREDFSGIVESAMELLAGHAGARAEEFQ